MQNNHESSQDCQHRLHISVFLVSPVLQSTAGRLPSTYPITWRNDSGLWDGQDQNRNLSGGYYIGGGNVKYHFPMAWTVTMLSWALLEYESVFRMVNMQNEMAQLIDWGVQYILESRYEDIIFAQVRPCIHLT